MLLLRRLGEENVIQIVTNNVVNYKAARELLMYKKKQKTKKKNYIGHLVQLTALI